jgi:uncharacterized alpha-E superfamily protein
VLSRIAGNCFWLGRYLERAENTARVVVVAHSASLIPTATDAFQPWADALKIAADPAAYRIHHKRMDGQAVATFMLVDRDNPSSVVSCLVTGAANARRARNRLGDAYWEAINRSWIEADNLDAIDIGHRGIDEIADWAITSCQLIRGCGDELLRDELPNVISAGCYLERADFILRLLAVSLPQASAETPITPGSLGYLRLENILNASATRDAFHLLHARDADAEDAAGMLLADPACPRSVLFNIVRLEAALSACTGGSCAALAQVAELRGLIRQAGGHPVSKELWTVLAQAHLMLGAVASAVERDHFSIPIPASAAEAKEG